MAWRPTAAPTPSPFTPQGLGDIWQSERQQASHKTAGVAALTQYQRDPVGFLVNVLGVSRETVAWSLGVTYETHQWDGTRDPLVVACESIANGEWVAVASGTSTGKTFLMAALLLWHLGCFKDSVTVTVATKEDQMLKGVWREVGRMFPKFVAHFPTAVLTTGRIRMDGESDAWAAWTVTAKVGAGETSASGVQGLHAAHLLILVDEMPGVPMPVMTALINTATDENNTIAGFGNPDHQADPLAKFGKMARVRAVRISALDHPNTVLGRSLVPGAVSRASIQMRADEYGVDSDMYKSRVRGIAPEQSEHALIKRQWVQAAFDRADAYRKRARESVWPVAYGVDPSNSDAGDEAAVARWEGPLCAVTASPCPNANVLGQKVWLQARSEGVAPEHIGVDNVGVGAGTTNEINRLAPSFCRALNSGAGPEARIEKMADGVGIFADANQFLNLRAQMHWQFREDLRMGRVALEPDEELLEELVAPTYEIRAGKVVIEPKADVRVRLGRSPNKADAVIYGNWVRPRSLPPSAQLASRDINLGIGSGADGKRKALNPQDVFRREHGHLVTPERGKWWSW